MKYVTFIVLISLSTFTSESSGQITSVADGLWATTTTWDLGRIPVASDSVVIATAVSVNTDQEMQALTVLPTGTLSGVAGNSRVLTVNATLLNQGNIAQSGTDDDFRIFLFGDVVNEGTLNVRRLWFMGSANQNLSQTSSATWLSTVLNNKTGGMLVAQTNLDIAGDFTLQSSSFRTLNMNDHDLIVSGSGTVSSIDVITGGRLVGRTASTAFARRATFVGNPTVVETVRLGPDVDFDSSLVVTGTLTGMKSSSPFNVIVDIAGDLTNTGSIIDEPAGGLLRLRVHGNLRNENVWSAKNTVFMGASDQTLFLAAGKKWMGGFDWEKTGGAAIATTAQVFGGATRIDSLRMEGLDLAVSGTGMFTNNSNIYTPATIQSVDGNEEFGTGTQIVGNSVIQNRFSPGFQLTVVGDLLVTGTLESLRGGITGTNTPMTIDGALTNSGTITNGSNGGVLSLLVSGNVTNTGSWNTGGLELINQGTRTVSVPGIESQVFCGMSNASRKTGAILLTGDNAMPDLSVTGERTCAVLFGATLALDDPPSSSLENFGSITVTQTSATGLNDQEYYQARGSVGPGVTNSISITHVGQQVPGSFGNAVPGWWKVASNPASAMLTELILSYDESTLSSSDEDILTVFHSDDGGTTWTRVSSSSNMTIEPISNRVRLSNVPASGDYVLSVFSQPITATGQVVVSLIGRSSIRLGLAPNRYTIQYANTSGSETGIMSMVVRAPEHTHITEIRPSNLPSNQPGFGNSADTFSIFEVTGNLQPDSVAFLLLEKMAPNEARIFDVILTADPDASTLSDPAVTASLMVPVIGDKDITKQIVLDTVAAEEEWASLGLQWPYNERPLAPFIDSALSRPDVTGKSGVLFALQTVLNIVARGTLVIVTCGLRSFFATRATTTPGLGNAADQVKRQLRELDNRNNAIKKAQKDVSRYELYLRCKKAFFASSIDPNEKIGPAGIETEGFISSLGRITYQILFENKAEATAPAFQVFIDDTLSTEFDPSTVVFDRESHPGFEMTVNGQHLHWEVTGIELPPNVNPPEGEGFVEFSVSPVANLPSGTALRNRATIVFDLNEPILTNEYVNTLDIRAPVTTMISLPESLPADSITVRWTASDAIGESGVQSTTLFSSKDGGPFASVGATFFDSLRVSVESGSEYSFYALSKDFVGNSEQQRPAVVSTMVVSGVATEDDAVPFVFGLDTNYPNPFNPVTTIQYTLPTPGSTRLEVFDVTGRLVARLVDSSLAAGRHSATWDARNVASGVYFYRLSQGNNLKTMPMVLLK